MTMIRGVEFLRLSRSLLCCGLLALLMAGCADDAARLMYRSQSELTRHRRMEAQSAARKRPTKPAQEELQATVDEAQAQKRTPDDGEAQDRTLDEGEVQKRTLDELQAALAVCLRAGGTYERCYRDQAAYLTCLAAGGRDADCRPHH